ncbi:PH domain-containing protein [Halobacillus rhizosphaerae]|uniref:PH domain-containing protein n=1 Tax=Halobacillus rhizosphaerae TaxID=3064889 RepID=UPI00398B213C
MREPSQRISEKALELWRIYGAIQVGIMLLISIGFIVLTNIWDWPTWIISIPLAATILLLVFSVWLIPLVKWKRWRYEVTDQEIELQHGLFIIQRTLVPMIRVQHVDTEQGPLLRKYRLATISISTAATVHKVPALNEQEAERLRLSISSLARVAEEDV